MFDLRARGSASLAFLLLVHCADDPARKTPPIDEQPENAPPEGWVVPGTIVNSGTMNYDDIGLFAMDSASPLTFTLNLSGYHDGAQICLDSGVTPSAATVHHVVEQIDVKQGSSVVGSVLLNACLTLGADHGTPLSLTLNRFVNGSATGGKVGRIFVGVRRDPVLANGQLLTLRVSTNGCKNCDLSTFAPGLALKFPWREMNLRSANLEGVLIEASSQGGGIGVDDFVFAGDYTGANLNEAEIDDFRASGSELGNGTVAFPGAAFSNATFVEATLDGAISGMDLRSADLTDAVLFGATYVGTPAALRSLAGAKLGGAQIDGCILSATDWTGTTGRPASFTENVLDCARFQGIDFTDGAHLDFTTITTAVPNNWPRDLAEGECPVDLTSATIDRTQLPFTQLHYYAFDGVTVRSGNPAYDAANTPFLGFSLPAGSNFRHARMRNWHFKGATFPDRTDFSSSDLSNTNFEEVILTDGNFASAKLSGANFSYADLTGSNFSSALLAASSDESADKPAKMIGTALHNVDLTTATVDGVDFTDAILLRDDGLPMLPSNLVGISLEGAVLTSQDFRNRSFQGTINLRDAVLIGANFSGTQFQSANVNLRFSYLQGVDFSGANLSGVDFEGAQFAAASGTAVVTSGPRMGTSLPYSANTLSVSTRFSASTTCPDGNSYKDGCGEDLSASRYVPAAAGHLPLCCVWAPGQPVCPRGKAVGQPCVAACECASRYCDAAGGASGTCYRPSS